MATFVVLINWTDQGIKNVKDTVERAEAASELAARMGCEMREIYWTLGPYDLVTVVEAPDDETATAMALAISSQGNVRTTTLRAFGAEEVTSILDKLPS